MIRHAKHLFLAMFSVVLLYCSGTAQAADILIGSCIYKFDDTFLTMIRNNMTRAAAEYGVDLEIVDSQNRQPTQNDQVDTYLTKGVDVLIISPVGGAAAALVKKAQAAGVPIVFVNNEPAADILQSYDKAWYVGARAEESGIMSGELIVDYFRTHPGADKNRDGVVQYIMLRGEQGHQDAPVRTKYSVEAIRNSGFGVQELGADNANWDKVLATDKMKGFIASVGLDKIEAVLSNNDDMALGAIEALKAEGYNLGDPRKYIPVVGVDATAPALEAMSKGHMLGTVLNDARHQGDAAVRLAIAAAKGQKIDKSTIGYDVSDGKYVWIPYVKVTAEQLKQGETLPPVGNRETTHMTAQELVAHFKMTPHPEGGFYAETYRSPGSVARSALPQGYSGDRSFSTAILFLLRQGDYSHLHRIRQDEVWHFYMGGPLRLVSLSPEGDVSETLLGTDLAHGQQVQSVVRGGSWFGATPAPGTDFTLVGCTVAPGFDFADFEMGTRKALEQAFPAAQTLIREFTTAE